MGMISLGRPLPPTATNEEMLADLARIRRQFRRERRIVFALNIAGAVIGTVIAVCLVAAGR